MLEGAEYSDPEFSWKYAVALVAIGFMEGAELGDEDDGNMIVGEAQTTLEGGYLFRFHLDEDGELELSGDLEDKVADNTDKFDITESEDLLFGRNPNRNLYVVSLSNGAIYEVYRQ